MAQGEVREKSSGARADTYAEEVNANAVVTLVAQKKRTELRGAIYWSYNGVPVGGRLTVFGGGFHIDFDITQDGPGFVPMYAPIHAIDDNDIIVTLYAGGAGLVGKLNVLCTDKD